MCVEHLNFSHFITKKKILLALAERQLKSTWNLPIRPIKRKIICSLQANQKRYNNFTINISEFANQITITVTGHIRCYIDQVMIDIMHDYNLL